MERRVSENISRSCGHKETDNMSCPISDGKTPGAFYEPFLLWHQREPADKRYLEIIHSRKTAPVIDILRII